MENTGKTLKQKKCKYCKSEIDTKAKVCPVCRKKLKHTGRNIFLCIFAVLMFFLIKDLINSPTAPSSYDIGEPAEKGGIQVTLLDIEESSKTKYSTPSDGCVFLICKFEIVNNTTSDLSVSSLMSVDAYVDGYQKTINIGVMGEETAFGEGQQLDMTIIPEKKGVGVVAYEASKDWKEMEIRLTLDGYRFTFKHENK